MGYYAARAVLSMHGPLSATSIAALLHICTLKNIESLQCTLQNCKTAKQSITAQNITATLPICCSLFYNMQCATLFVNCNSMHCLSSNMSNNCTNFCIQETSSQTLKLSYLETTTLQQGRDVELLA